MTVGAPEDDFKKDGLFGCIIEEYMQSMKYLSKFTAMKFGSIILLGGVSYKNRTNPESIKEQKEKCIKFAE